MDPKRPRYEASEMSDSMRYKKYQPHSQSSRVIQATGLGPNVTEADLVHSLSQFGPVNYASLTGPGSALVEFEDQSAAERCIATTLTTNVTIAEQPAFYNYANIDTIPRKGIESERPSNVLVMHVHNAKYPITPEVVHKICSPISPVIRIMITRRDGVQALVEFPDLESARMVKQYLNGCDIYSSCCTLKIDYAKLTHLTFTGDGPDQADYTKGVDAISRPGLETPKSEYPSTSEVDRRHTERSNVPMNRIADDNFGHQKPYYAASRPEDAYPPAEERSLADREMSGGPGRGGAAVDYRMERNGRGPYFEAAPIYGRPRYDEAAPPYEELAAYGAGGGSGGVGAHQPFPPYRDGRMPYPESRGPYPDEGAAYYESRDNYMPVYGSGRYPAGGAPGYDEGTARVGEFGYPPEGVVIMIYGLDPEIVNCDRLFNLLCLYGNVMKIKFLITRNDTVMVEMMNMKGAQRVMDFLHNCRVFGKTIHVAFSRQAYLNEVRDPPKLKDGTASYKDYADSRLQRFSSPHIATKNRITHPQKYLYFFNAPPNVTEENLVTVFRDANAPLPLHVRIFSKRGEMVKNSAGILEFDDAVAATEALMFCNHASVDCPGNKSPFIMKLCFAGPANTAVGGGGGGSSTIEMRGGGRGAPGPAGHYPEPMFMGQMGGRPRSGDYSGRGCGYYDAEPNPPPGSGGGYRSSGRGRRYD